MKREIFRKEALDRLSSPEQLDALMPVTSRHGWIALLGIGLLLLMGLTWGIAGTVETTVEGSGLLMRHGGFQSIAAPQAGRVETLNVKVDSTVKPGDLLLTLSTGDEVPHKTEVRAPIAGRVLDISAVSGNAVAKDDVLLSIESPEAPLQSVVYVSTKSGFKVEPGMEVRITPATATSQGASFLRGQVKSVARFPVTRTHLTSSLQNEEWVNNLMQIGPALEVVIDVTGQTSLERLYSGTPCDASIIVAMRRPINVLFPSH